MNPQNQTPQQPVNPMPANTSPIMPAAHPEHKKVGPIIATLVIVLVLVIAALYLFASRINQQSAPIDAAASTNTAPQQTTASQSQSVQPVTNNSDDIQSIQADLNASTNGVDSQNF